MNNNVALLFFMLPTCVLAQVDERFLQVRYRMQHIEHEWLPIESSDISTARLRAHWQSDYDSWGLLAEYDANVALFSDPYNDGSNGELEYPKVIDPEYHEINQLAIHYQGVFGLVALGRQGINWDNQRFIGSDSFRQNEQTMDGLTYVYDADDDFTVRYAYLWQVNSIYDPDEAQGRFDSSSHLLNMHYMWTLQFEMATYYYQFAFSDRPWLANRTIGAYVMGSQLFDAWPLGYRIEYARQHEGQNTPEYALGYHNIALEWPMGSWLLTLGVERLAGNGTREFITPLASLHQHNGWADRFIYGQKGLGLEDRYVKLQYQFATDWLVNFEYHAHTRPTSQKGAGQIDYGDEWGILVAKSYAVWSFELGYVRYRPEDGNSQILEIGSNTQSFWLSSSYRY